ncbi:MAG: amidohydrolase [Acidobacteria bacterium]|nr:amidohydrolase [Acidobacteriota bacterium]
MKNWIALPLALLIGCSLSSSSAPARKSVLPALPRIDVHTHVFNPTPTFHALLNRLNLRVLNICVLDRHSPAYSNLEEQQAAARAVFRASKGRAPWCSSFDPSDWEVPGFSRNVIDQLNKTFDDGAIAVKIYKVIGMELKSETGQYLMPDDPVFIPIFKAIEVRNRTLYAHLAEPWSAWRPLDPASPHYGYYKNNPDWHMYLHPERPAKETILAARDHILERHPKLRVVGAHLGSMEDNVDEIAQRLDLYPNFAVDTAARVPDLMLQPTERVRAFFIKYQDRVLYGTDLSLMPSQKPEEAVKEWEVIYARDWKFFATNETVEYEDRKIQGLALPEPVLRKFYRENAIRWLPGIESAKN